MYIYLITNLTNNKKYIGQTIRNPQERFREHCVIIDYDSNKNPQLIDIKIKEYGKENFSFQVIDRAFDINKLNEKEEYYIHYYNTHVSNNNGYNVKYGGNNHRHTAKTKEKISVAQIGVKNHMYGVKGADNKTSKRIKEIYSDTIFESATIASETLSLQHSKICASARGVRISTGGCVFRYLNEEGNTIEPKTSLDSPVYCVELNKRYDSTADAEYELFAKITGRIMRAIKMGHRVNNMKFELC